MLVDKSLREFLDHVAGVAPTPGDGSIAALAGALGLSLLSATCRRMIALSDYREIEPELRTIATQTDLLREDLCKLLEAHAFAVQALTITTTESFNYQKWDSWKYAKLENASVTVVAVPLAIAHACQQGILLFKTLEKKINSDASADIGVGSALCESALQAAIVTAQTYVEEITDDAFSREVQLIIDEYTEALHNYKEHSLAYITDSHQLRPADGIAERRMT